MLSGKKRNAKELSKSPIPTKRAKTKATNDKPNSPNASSSFPAPTTVWPRKQKPLTSKQRSELPRLLNPSLHRSIFESFWNKRQFGAPSLDMYESASPSNPKAKLFQCRITLTNKRDPSQLISVDSMKFDSKKKAEISAFSRFNTLYIPFTTLCALMRPLSSTSKASLPAIATRTGEHLRGRTSTLRAWPIPLQCSEVDIVRLLRVGNHDSVQYIWFERASDRAIFKTVGIELDTPKTAEKAVSALNGRLWRNHRLTATFAADDKHPMKRKSVYLKVVGLPSRISPRRVERFLNESAIDVMEITQVSRYSLFTQVFMRFDKLHESVGAFEKLNSISFVGNGAGGEGKKRAKGGEEKWRLYARYSGEEEYAEAVKYSKDVKKRHDEVLRRSVSVDVENVPWDTTEEQLTAVFGKCGEVKRSNINHRKDLYPGTAFVEFADEKSAEMAILRLNGYELGECMLRVSMHLKQTRADKKLLKQWYTEQEEQQVQNDKQRKIKQAQKKKEKAKRKSMRRKMRKLRRA